MKLMRSSLFLLIYAALILPGTLYADSLGHLFTSEQERNRLDYIRSQKIVVKKKSEAPEEVDELLEADKVEEAVIRDTINIRGLVKRSDGKNSAWINDSNTYEGDLDTLYIKVGPDGISNDTVKIQMPDNETEVELRVGEAYDPNSEQVLEQSAN